MQGQKKKVILRKQWSIWAWRVEERLPEERAFVREAHN